MRHTVMIAPASQGGNEHYKGGNIFSDIWSGVKKVISKPSKIVKYLPIPGAALASDVLSTAGAGMHTKKRRAKRGGAKKPVVKRKPPAKKPVVKRKPAKKPVVKRKSVKRGGNLTPVGASRF
jgi:hypothetical protein